MVSENNLPNLRAQAADLEKRVGRKFSRTKSKTGAIVGGSEFDPRRGAQVNKMRSRDVAAHIRKLEKVLDRSTQFVAGAKGAPLPRAGWVDYKGSETAVRDKFAADLEAVKDERLPGPPSATETVGQRQDKIRSKHPTAMNMGYIPPEREPFNIKDADSLTKLTKANKKRMTKKWAKDEHKRAQTEFKKMVEVFNDQKLTDSVMNLTYGQFDMLWNLTAFADKMSIAYHHIQSKYKSKQEIPESVKQDQVKEAQSLIDWIKKFDI